MGILKKLFIKFFGKIGYLFVNNIIMGQRLILSEDEKKNIQEMYGLIKEQNENVINELINFLTSKYKFEKTDYQEWKDRAYDNLCKSFGGPFCKGNDISFENDNLKITITSNIVGIEDKNNNLSELEIGDKKDNFIYISEISVEQLESLKSILTNLM